MGEFNWIRRIPGYHYYDTPEDEDCFKKIIFMNKMGLYFGVTLGSLDVLCISKPVGLVNIAGRYGLVTLPILATGSAFAAATCLTANYRGKIDFINATVGGFVAGCTLGGVLRNGILGSYAAVLFAATAAALRSADEMGVKYIKSGNEKDPSNPYGIWSVKFDTSITKERPKGWINGDLN